MLPVRCLPARLHVLTDVAEGRCYAYTLHIQEVIVCAAGQDAAFHRACVVYQDIYLLLACKYPVDESIYYRLFGNIILEKMDWIIFYCALFLVYDIYTGSFGTKAFGQTPVVPPVMMQTLFLNFMVELSFLFDDGAKIGFFSICGGVCL